MPKKKHTFFSIIVLAHNEEKTLPNILKKLKQQKYSKKFNEIIISENGSTDNTLKIAKKQKTKNIHYIKK